MYSTDMQNWKCWRCVECDKRPFLPHMFYDGTWLGCATHQYHPMSSEWSLFYYYHIAINNNLFAHTLSQQPANQQSQLLDNDFNYYCVRNVTHCSAAYSYSAVYSLSECPGDTDIASPMAIINDRQQSQSSGGYCSYYRHKLRLLSFCGIIGE